MTPRAIALRFIPAFGAPRRTIAIALRGRASAGLCSSLFTQGGIASNRNQVAR